VNRRFVLAMARREGRSSWRRLILYGSSMALGIAAVVALQGVRASVRDAVDHESQRVLGADLRLASRTPLPADLAARVETLTSRTGVAAAHMTRFGSMALEESSNRTRLVDVQAAEPAYPFFGTIETEPPELWSRLHDPGDAEPSALVDPSVLLQLDGRIGGTIALGQTRFRVIGTVAKAPGSIGLQASVAPRMFISRRHVASTGLVVRGSLIDHLIFLRVPEPTLTAWLDANADALESAHVRVQTVAKTQNDLSRSFAALTRYLGLVGLASLLLGGIGVASGISVFVREKYQNVAVLRSLGANSHDILASYGLLALVLGGIAGISGAAAGTALQWALPTLLRNLLPVEVAFKFQPGVLLTGVLLGLWLTSLFVAAPLFDLSRVPPLRALRRDSQPARGAAGGRTSLVIALTSSLLAASLWQAPRVVTGFVFAAALAGVLAALTIAASGSMALLRRHRPRRGPFWARQALANLFRPRNHTLSTTLAIGFGIFLVATLHIVQHNVLSRIASDTRPDRPNLVLFDVQPDQVAELEAFLSERDTHVYENTPLVSARIGGLRNRSTGNWLDDAELDKNFRWSLQHEYRLTFSEELRETEEIVAGRWWHAGPLAPGEATPISLEVKLAESLGIELGDEIVWDIQGIPIESVVTSLRVVNWGRLATNFFVVFPPGVLEQAPHTNVLLLRVADPEQRAMLQRDLVGQFPNIAALDATVILRALDAVLKEVGLAVQALALLTLATGLLILVAATVSSRHERTREALMLRTLGASSAVVRRIVAGESFALALLATVVGTSLSLAASAALVHFVFELPFSPPWRDLSLFVLVTLAITTGLGWLNGRPAASDSPLASLREAERHGAGA
jgi:putative ABC transport system permease protein